jgi:hypothetical protein
MAGNLNPKKFHDLELDLSFGVSRAKHAKGKRCLDNPIKEGDPLNYMLHKLNISFVHGRHIGITSLFEFMQFFYSLNYI